MWRPTIDTVGVMAIFASQRPTYGIVLSMCSNFVEEIHHFAARPQN